MIRNPNYWRTRGIITVLGLTMVALLEFWMMVFDALFPPVEYITPPVPESFINTDDIEVVYLPIEPQGIPNHLMLDIPVSPGAIVPSPIIFPDVPHDFCVPATQQDSSIKFPDCYTKELP